MLIVRVRGHQVHRQVGGAPLALGEPGEPIAEAGIEPPEASIDTVSGLMY